jgi:7-keto-8-aminopelargonate synthetase-like enzyme
LYFAGTGYLGLQAHPAVLAAAVDGVRKYGVHSATTRSGFGNIPPVLEVERRIAEFMGTDDACYLVSGYAGNFALAAELRDTIDIAFIDEAAHDCLREAVYWLNLRQPVFVFRHRDVAHLAELLTQQVRPTLRPLIMTDGVFAASGRLAPICEYRDLLGRYDGAALLVDDAHGVGVLGEEGRGSLELAGFRSTDINAMDRTAEVRLLQSITLSKAIGGHGGTLSGSREFLSRVRNASGWFRGASAPAAPVAAATAKAVELVQAQSELRRMLGANITYAREQLRSLGFAIEDLPTAIISIELAAATEMQRIQQLLLAEGVAVAYTRHYAGAGPDGMLRIAIFATHTREMIDHLIAAFRRVL